MKCEQYLKQLSPYIDNQLSSSEKEQLEAHLASCENCAQELESLKIMITLCEQIEEPKLPEHFHESVMKRVAKEEIVQSKKVKFLMNKWVYWSGAVAASLLVCMVWLINAPIMDQPEIAQVPQPRGVQMERAVPFKVAMDTPEEVSQEAEIWQVTTPDRDALEKWLIEQGDKYGYQVQITDTGYELSIQILGLLDKVSLKDGLAALDGTNIEVKEPKEGQSVTIIVKK